MPVTPTDTRALDQNLERDPAGVYAAMDEATREQYRQACWTLAAWSKKEVLAVAQEAIRLSEEREPGDERGRHVGTQLLAEGRPQLEARLGCLVPWRERATRLLRRHGPNAYVGSLVVLLLLALLGVERFLAARGVELPHRVLLPVLLSVSLIDFIEYLVTSLLSSLAPRLKPLPRLDPQRVFSPDTRTLVVTPLLVSSAEDIENQLRMLEINFLGNVEPELFFALLTDFRDAPEKDLPGEQTLLELLEKGIRELNERHGYREQPRFFWFHRERRWNPVAGRWMGWERKRGKLDEFNRLVLGARDTSYTGEVPGIVHTLRYILTLDADTHLLPGDAARLVATLHHPLNQARFDASGKQVIAGYSMLQPSPEFGPNREHWLASGGWPLSLTREKKKPKPDYHWVLHQRLFGTGDFIGKGLYDVAAFTRSLEGRFPENAILSHDRIEGMFARVAYVHDIKIFESPPKNYGVLARVWHRWLRGDWQLLPWVFPRVPTQEGRRVANTLSLFDRWKLLTELRRSLHFPFAVLVIAYGWFWLPGSSVWKWTLGATLWACRHSLLFGLMNTFRTAARARSVLTALRTLAFAIPAVIGSTVISTMAFIPNACLVLDAIVRVLYRLAFDRSRMLDWTTHAQSSRGGRGLFVLSLPEVWGSVVLSLSLAGGLAAFNPEALPWASVQLLSWIPFVVVGQLQRPPAPRRAGPPPEELDRLRALARSAWARCEQWEPSGKQPGGETEVTPTELALWLVAPVSAYHLDYLKLDALVARLDESLAIIASLERHRGHLLDRYDLSERRPVGPRHISTAQSGVLAAALVVVESGLRAARGAASGSSPTARLEEVEAKARALREELDFGFLHDGTMDLLHAGYDVETGTRDGAHHGLLTSGAMLAGYMAIARRQVPLSHWLSLAASDQRLREKGAVVTGHDALAEHLLSTLFLWYPPNTLLAQAAHATVDAGLGTREAGAHLSMLSLRFKPEQALENFRRVAELDVAVSNQAMALAAVANAVCDDVLVQHFHRHWQTAWVEALVYETKDAS